MDFNSCVQETKTTHADEKYHTFHQVVDQDKRPSVCATKFDHKQDFPYGKAQVHKSALFVEDRDARIDEIVPLVLPTQLPSDSDGSDDEVGKENTIYPQENRAPLMTINSVLHNVQNVRLWLLTCYFHLFLIMSFAIIIFVFKTGRYDEQWTIVQGAIYMLRCYICNNYILSNRLCLYMVVPNFFSHNVLCNYHYCIHNREK